MMPLIGESGTARMPHRVRADVTVRLDIMLWQGRSSHTVCGISVRLLSNSAQYLCEPDQVVSNRLIRISEQVRQMLP